MEAVPDAVIAASGGKVVGAFTFLGLFFGDDTLEDLCGRVDRVMIRLGLSQDKRPCPLSKNARPFRQDRPARVRITERKTRRLVNRDVALDVDCCGDIGGADRLADKRLKVLQPARIRAVKPCNQVLHLVHGSILPRASLADLLRCVPLKTHQEYINDPSLSDQGDCPSGGCRRCNR